MRRFVTFTEVACPDDHPERPVAVPVDRIFRIERADDMEGGLADWTHVRLLPAAGETMCLAIVESVEDAVALVHSAQAKTAEPMDARLTPLRDMGMSVRARNVCIRFELMTAGHIATAGREYLRTRRGCGPGTIYEIENVLNYLGLQLAD